MPSMSRDLKAEIRMSDEGKVFMERPAWVSQNIYET
jgi:hypothetical protein